jgi:hypothetical protein
LWTAETAASNPASIPLLILSHSFICCTSFGLHLFGFGHVASLLSKPRLVNERVV